MEAEIVDRGWTLQEVGKKLRRKQEGGGVKSLIEVDSTDMRRFFHWFNGLMHFDAHRHVT